MSNMSNAPNDPRWDSALFLQQDESFKGKKKFYALYSER